MLSLSLNSVSLDDIVVVVSSLEGSLHTSKLMLNSIELHTSLFSGLSDLSDLLFFLTEGEIDSLVLIRELFGESILQTGHQWLKETRASKLVN